MSDVSATRFKNIKTVLVMIFFYSIQRSPQEFFLKLFNHLVRMICLPNCRNGAYSVGPCSHTGRNLYGRLLDHRVNVPYGNFIIQRIDPSKIKVSILKILIRDLRHSDCS